MKRLFGFFALIFLIGAIVLMSEKAPAKLAHGSFALAISCMDGRIQELVLKHTHELSGADHVDNITRRGGILRIFSEHNAQLEEDILQDVAVSVQKHQSEHIYVFSHEQCAGYPESEEIHRAGLHRITRILKKRFTDCAVESFWIKRNTDEDWNFLKVDTIGQR